MPCCCCCHFDEDLDRLNKKDEKKVAYLCKKQGLVQDKHPLSMKDNHGLLAKRQRYSVYLNVYDLISNKRNKKLDKIGMAVYHSGIELGRHEYSFGEPMDSKVVTGIFVVSPMTAMNTLSHRIFLGDTIISLEAIDTLVKRMKLEWPASKYELLYMNCNHFAGWFCKQLTTIQPLVVPKWVNRVANAANCITPRCFAKRVMKRLEEQAQAPPKSSTKGQPTLSDAKKKEAERAEEKKVAEQKQKEATKQLEHKKKQQRIVGGALDKTPPRPGGMPNFNAGREPPSSCEKKVEDDHRMLIAVEEIVPMWKDTPVSVSEARLQTIAGETGVFEFGDCKLDLSTSSGGPTAPRMVGSSKKIGKADPGAAAALSDINFSDDEGGAGPEGFGGSTTALPIDDGFLGGGLEDSPLVVIPAGHQPARDDEDVTPSRNVPTDSASVTVAESSYGTPVVPHLQERSKERGGTTPALLSTGAFARLQAEDNAKSDDGQSDEVVHPTVSSASGMEGARRRSLLLMPVLEEDSNNVDRKPSSFAESPPTILTNSLAQSSNLLAPLSTPPPTKGFTLKKKDSDSDDDDDDSDTDDAGRKLQSTSHKVAERKTAAGITVNDKGEIVVEKIVTAATLRKASAAQRAAASHVDPTTGESALPELNIDPAELQTMLTKRAIPRSTAPEDGDTDDEGPIEFSDAEDDYVGPSEDDNVTAEVRAESDFVEG